MLFKIQLCSDCGAKINAFVASRELVEKYYCHDFLEMQNMVLRKRYFLCFSLFEVLVFTKIRPIDKIASFITGLQFSIPETHGLVMKYWRSPLF